MKKIKKIAIITNVIKPGGGPAGYTYNLIGGLKKIGDQSEKQDGIRISNFEIQICSERVEERTNSVWIISKSKSDILKSILDKVTNGLWRQWKQILMFHRGANYSKREIIKNSDLVIFQGYQDVSFLFYALKKKKKCIYMPHSPTCVADEYLETCILQKVLPNVYLYKKLLADEEAFLTLCNYLIFPSPNSNHEYLKKFMKIRKEDIKFIKSGIDSDIDEEKYLPEFNSEGKIKVLFAGRYITHKGFDLYLELAELASKKSKNFRFFSAGGGQIEATQFVTDLGWRKDIQNIIKNCDIVIIPNRVAYYDLLPLEVAALGKPMIFTPVGGNVDQHEILSETLCSKVSDSNSLFNELLAYEEIRRNNPAYGANNKYIYNENFTATKLAERWLGLLNTIAEEGLKSHDYDSSN